MNLNKLRDPFAETVENKKPTVRQKREKLIKIYELEKKKALRLYGNYSIKKVNRLQQLLLKAQNQIDAGCQTTR